ncbi:rifin PIR protein,putative [Plasmodium sp. DRC-Itaito]|nr:rifin PIR protein,putative [Plasmodium sp. DRC-Itaito]
MKLQYFKILLFALPLNVLEHTKNKPSITPHHTPIYISRVLSEKDIQSSNYDKDEEMISVKENFDRQSTQRLREYDERLKDKRQKHKEQRDKNIQKIIEKDKREKSLTDKIEIGCLRCGCALGGVAASVGVFGGLGTYGWKMSALATAEKAAIAEVAAAGEAARIPEIIMEVIAGITKEFRVSTVGVARLESLYTANTYNNVKNIARAINDEYKTDTCLLSGPNAENSICGWVLEKYEAAQKIRGKVFSTYDSIEVAVEKIVSNAETAATEKATATLIEEKTSEIAATCMGHQTAIIASVVVLLIIAFVMIIVYLVLRYRRKKKMNKKAQYTKFLKE